MRELKVDSQPRDEMKNVIRYWRLVELFSPQKVENPDPKNDRRPVVRWRQGRPLPWDVLPPAGQMGNRTMVWQHTVYLGVYQLEDIYEFLHAVFPQDSDAYDERPNGRSACAGLVVGDDGRLIADSAVLSSALWGVGRTADPGVQNPAWLDGFDDAQGRLSESLTEFVADVKRERRLTDDPHVDQEMLLALLSLAQHAAGVVGLEALSTTDVYIASTRVREDRAGALPGYDFLNSFFLDDLGLVADAEWGAALHSYLTPENSLPVRARVDVRQQPEAVIEGTSIERLPPGRWLSNPEHPLATSQQFAVNEILNTLGPGRGLLGVNGPPGTGKTTMLRDVLAGNVVRRARALTLLKHPDEAFVAPDHTWKSGGGYPRCVRQLRSELTGFEMVVASSNNAAVANVSDELPRRTQIHDHWGTTADYFGDLATEVACRSHDGDDRPTRAWGLVAARLGNARNRTSFNSAFWFGKGTQTDPHDPANGVIHGMQQLLKSWEADPTSRPSWTEARATFLAAQQRVEEQVEERRGAARRRARQAQVHDLTDGATQQLRELQQRAQATEQELAWARSDVHKLEEITAACSVRRQRHLEVRPGSWEALLSFGKATKVWRMALAPLNFDLDAAEREERIVGERVSALEQRVSSIYVDRDQLAHELAMLRDEHKTLEQAIAVDAERYGRCYPGLEWHRDDTMRELHGAWLDAELNEARSDLFLAALDLHRVFLANASGIRQGLMASLDVMMGAAPRDLDSAARRAAWQLFFMAVPLISTTFASIGRMLKGVDREAIGWLLIDEAGQATPQAAVGAIWRARRVVAVGDPMQLTPVVAIPRRAQHDLAKRFDVEDDWIPSYTSVQGVADRVGRFGTTLTNGPEPVWVSSPLRVHRRCDSPMFDISNAIAYEGMMINGVHRGNDDFHGVPPSQWLDVPAQVSGDHLQKAETRRLRGAVSHLVKAGLEVQDIIAISPFRAVANELERLADVFPGMKGGTIHTAQGREAPVVFLVLGGDPQRPGAKRWASSTPNLVNVATSRAQRRLYVIGDRESWSRYPYFDTLAKGLSILDPPS